MLALVRDLLIIAFSQPEVAITNHYLQTRITYQTCTCFKINKQ